MLHFCRKRENVLKRDIFPPKYSQILFRHRLAEACFGARQSRKRNKGRSPCITARVLFVFVRIKYESPLVTLLLPSTYIRFYITNPVISTTCYRQRAIWQLSSYDNSFLFPFCNQQKSCIFVIWKIMNHRQLCVSGSISGSLIAGR